MERLLPQTKEQIQEMKELGFPICLSRGDWSGKHPRHCNTCIKQYKKHYLKANRL